MPESVYIEGDPTWAAELLAASRAAPMALQMGINETEALRRRRPLIVRDAAKEPMGRLGSCFDDAAAESFFSTLEHEVLSRHHFATRAEARAVIGPWCYEFYNHHRRTTSAGELPPGRYEMMLTDAPSAA